MSRSGIAQEVVRAVLSVTGGPAGHHPPRTTKEDLVAVMDQLRDLGSYNMINEFEGLLAKRCGRRYAVATSSGTAALEVALAAAGIGQDSTVVIPALGFVAAANAIVHRGAKPVLMDVYKDDFGIAWENLDANPPIDAVVAIHNLGHPCRIEDTVTIAEGYGAVLIEDTAEAIGSTALREKPCGSFGRLSVLSFNLNKVVTTGGGGAVLCDDDRLARIVRRLASTARVQHPWLVEHDAVAWNHRMPMLPAALGLAQLRRLDVLVAAKRSLAEAYHVAFEGNDDVTFHVEPLGTRSNYWLPTIMVPPKERDAVLTALHEVGVMARAVFTPVNQLAPYRQDGFPIADRIFRSAVCLPAGLELAERFL